VAERGDEAHDRGVQVHVIAVLAQPRAMVRITPM